MKATNELRYLKKITYVAKYPPSEVKHPVLELVLQQKWLDEDNKEQGKDVPIVEDSQ